MASSPFILLTEIAQKCRANAKGLPRQEVASGHWSGIGFQIKEDFFVAPLSEISEVTQLNDLTMVPGVVDWLLGVANLRGNLLPITDLLGFLTGNKQYISRKNKVIVVNHKDRLAGLLIEKMLGLQRFVVTLKAPVAAEVSEDFRPYVSGSYTDTIGQLWHIFSIQSIFESARFSHVGT